MKDEGRGLLQYKKLMNLGVGHWIRGVERKLFKKVGIRTVL